MHSTRLNRYCVYGSFCIVFFLLFSFALLYHTQHTHSNAAIWNIWYTIHSHMSFYPNVVSCVVNVLRKPFYSLYITCYTCVCNTNRFQRHSTVLRYFQINQIFLWCGFIRSFRSFVRSFQFLVCFSFSFLNVLYSPYSGLRYVYVVYFMCMLCTNIPCVYLCDVRTIRSIHILDSHRFMDKTLEYTANA